MDPDIIPNPMPETEALEPWQGQHTDLATRLATAERRITALVRDVATRDATIAALTERLESMEPIVQFLEEIRRSAETDNGIWGGIMQIVHSLEPSGNGKGPLMQGVAHLCKRPFKLY